MEKTYSVEGNRIVIHRELMALDQFVKQFLDILKKHSDYLIVSGFVSISTGRSRGTEDVDILVPVVEKDTFTQLFKELEQNGFWCYQGSTAEEVYEYIVDLTCVRFARVGEMFPNMEVIPINKTKKVKYFEFTHPQNIRIQDFAFKIPPIEFEILYKEIVLGGEKDFADARHLRTFFKDFITDEKFKEYKPIVRQELQ
jgi:hypothetical protein